jgi:tRNA threonylcarbamoyladenosine modification (KEOPS) complex Cgi121 subunit
MIREVEGFDKYLSLSGFKNAKISNSDVLVKQIRKNVPLVDVQFFDASLIAGSEHLYFAVLNALKAFKNCTNISKSLAVESLLYASAQRQIKDAVKLIGIKENTTRIAVVGIADSLTDAKYADDEALNFINGDRDDSVIAFSDAKIKDIRNLFQISDIELASKTRNNMDKEIILNLIIEHMAILVTQR